jgi:LPPG:FO 2-phospho-L-lactate transferase
MLVVLTGGTGGAKLIEGLAAEVDPAQLTIVCNTGDDCVFHGLQISPDIDTITYTLAGMSDARQGWGIKGDSFTVLEQLRRLGNDAWFKLGDRDFATHLMRTRLLSEGLTLSQVTARIRSALGVKAKILPMSDDRIETRVITPEGEISFQEFFVKDGWSSEVVAVHFRGAERSRAAPGVLDVIRQSTAVIIAPSNPVTSIGPILAIAEIRKALQRSVVPVAAVSPLIGNKAVSGPAHKLMAARGMESNVFGVADGYRDLLNRFIIDREDGASRSRIEKLGIRVAESSIRLSSSDDKRRLAREVLALVKK